MKIPLSNLPHSGLELHLSEANKEVASELKDLLPETPFQLDLAFQPVAEHYEMNGKLSTKRHLECAFCGEEFDHKISENFHELLFPKWLDEHHGRVSPEEILKADVDIVTGLQPDSFEPVPYVRELIEFATPLQPSCRPNCKGLCAQCGTNLNESNCDCEKNQHVGHVAFAGLKNLKVDKKH